MAIITRASKGAELDHAELDNNFTELESRITGKANTAHTHSIGDITGLQDELDSKIDMGDTNVPNGLLLLGSDGKVPCEFLKDCFDVASKVSTNDLFDTGGIIKANLLPSGGGGNCDCVQIEADILDLQNNKANWIKIVRKITQNNEALTTDEDIVIIDDLIESFDISQNAVQGRVLKLRRIGGTNIELSSNVNFAASNQGHLWEGIMSNTMELVYSDNLWVQIG